MTFVPQPSAFSLAAARLGDGGTLTGIAVSRAELAGPHRLLAIAGSGQRQFS
jgi:precorrin-6B methylase 1